MLKKLVKVISIPEYFSCIVSVMSLLYAVLSNCVYQTSDDMEMRILLEGSIGGQKGETSPFSMYMSVTYGRLLQFLYAVFPDIYWFDCMNFLFIFVSSIVISLAVSRNMQDMIVEKKIIVFAVMLFLGISAYKTVQFTKTSFLLAFSGFLCYYMIVQRYYISRYRNIILSVLCAVCFLLSSCIRFENMLFATAFVLLLFAWSLPYKEIVKNRYGLLVPLISILAVVCCRISDDYLCSRNPSYAAFNMTNSARAAMTDMSNMYDLGAKPWMDAEKSLDAVDLQDARFSKGDLRLLMTTQFLGNLKINSPENLQKVAEKTGAYIHPYTMSNFTFKVKDYVQDFFWWIVLILAISVFFMRNWTVNLYILFVFYMSVSYINFAFKTAPPRLWFGMTFAVIIALLITGKELFLEKHSGKLLRSGLVLICCLSACMIEVKNNAYAQNRFTVYKNIQKNMPRLSDDRLYLTDIMVHECGSIPFTENVFRNIVCTSIYCFMPEVQMYMKKFFAVSDDIFLNIIDNNGKIRLLYNTRLYSGFAEATMEAISYAMKEKYDKIIAFYPEEKIDDFIVIQCLTLSDEDIDLKRKCRNIHSEDAELKRRIRYAYIRDALGRDAESRRIEEKMRILDSYTFEGTLDDISTPQDVFRRFSEIQDPHAGEGLL